MNACSCWFPLSGIRHVAFLVLLVLSSSTITMALSFPAGMLFAHKMHRRGSFAAPVSDRRRVRFITRTSASQGSTDNNEATESSLTPPVLTRACNPNGYCFEVIVIEPPAAGQLETVLAQDGSWRIVEAHTINRQAAFGNAIAELLGHGSFLGRTLRDDTDIDEAVRNVSAGAKLFFLPHTTLCDPNTVSRLGLHDRNFYGGSVIHPNEQTKLIMHGLWQKESVCPEGWNDALTTALEPHTLPGYSVFDVQDLRAAARYLLKQFGGARIKLAAGSGSEGQYLLSSAKDLDDALVEIVAGNHLEYGASVEVDLFDADAWNISIDKFCNLSLATAGRLLRPLGADRTAFESMVDAITVRGTLDDLDLSLVDYSEEDLKALVHHVQAVEKAVELYLPQRLSSRKAYNAIIGWDMHGNRHVGVIEQTWRRG